MLIEESGIFIKQVYRIKKKFRSVESDVNSLKDSLPALAFKSIFPRIYTSLLFQLKNQLTREMFGESEY
jgi:hypothetical protein